MFIKPASNPLANLKPRVTPADQVVSEKRFLFLGIQEDAEYFPNLNNLFEGKPVKPVIKEVQYAAEVTRAAAKHGYTGIVTSRTDMLKALLGWHDSRKEPSLDTYQGSVFRRDGIDIIIVKPLAFMSSVASQTFLNKRFISKLTHPERWASSVAFEWIHGNATPSMLPTLLEEFATASLIAIDIETIKWNKMIDSVSWTAIWIGENGIEKANTLVLEMDSMWALEWIRKFNKLDVDKIGHNFKYDLSYFFRFNALPTRWLWDTINCFHSWYSELPKDLSTVAAFLIRDYTYWKDLATSSSRQDQLRYNALDTFATALAFCAWLVEAPEWAKRNYVQKFPVNFPAFMCDMRGIKRNAERHMQARMEIDVKEQQTLDSLRASLAEPAFNPGSHVQVKAVLTLLGCKDIAEKSSNEKSLAKASFRHPLNERIFNQVLEIRGLRKLKSTYLRTDDDEKKNGEGGAKEFKGRVFYSIIPYGTDTGRNACSESAFWCGFQIHNIPRGPEIKQTLEADDGFLFAENDLEQAESRDTAYVSGDDNLIDTVENSPDFHSSNASMFFGVPFEEIFDAVKNKVLNKPLRTLAKPVNHGANYNMGENTLVETMGLAKIFEAARLLNLGTMSARNIAAYLLACFHRTYPKIRSVYYECVKRDVRATRMLVSRTRHFHWSVPLESISVHMDQIGKSALAGWTRYCFGNPDRNKLDLNSLVAHVPQSLNAMTVDKAFMHVFYEIAINPKYYMNFRMNAQIHDSILYQFREGHEYICEEVKKRMEIPVLINSYDGKVRKFVVPASIKAGKDGKGAKFWSETE